MRSFATIACSAALMLPSLTNAEVLVPATPTPGYYRVNGIVLAVTHQDNQPITQEADEVVLNLMHACDERITANFSSRSVTTPHMSTLVSSCAQYLITSAVYRGYLSGTYVIHVEN